MTYRRGFSRDGDRVSVCLGCGDECGIMFCSDECFVAVNPDACRRCYGRGYTTERDADGDRDVRYPCRCVTNKEAGR